MSFIFFMDMIAEGAEAKILKLENGILKKIRMPKSYRLDVLDLKLRKSRNRREFKVLNKLNDFGVNVPQVYEIFEKDEISFTFEYIEGNVLKDVMNKNLLFLAFGQIILMHKFGVVHGDLTTLNILVKNNEIYLIDFGLSDFNFNIELRAVDLNLFFTCIRNEHPNFFKYKSELLEKYSAEFGTDVLKRLDVVEHRGRNK